MNISSKGIPAGLLQQAALYSVVGIGVCIVVAMNVINGIGRQFSQEDSYLRQTDAYLTGKIISYGKSLQEYAISFVAQKKVEALPLKLLKNDPKKEVELLVKATLETIQTETYEEALIYINKHHPLQLSKEVIATNISIEVRKIAQKDFNKEKLFAKPLAIHHKNKYLGVFRIALEHGVSCEEAKAIADETKGWAPNVHDVRVLIKRRQGGMAKEIQRKEKGHDLANKNSVQQSSPTDSVLTRIPSWEPQQVDVSPGSNKIV